VDRRAVNTEDLLEVFHDGIPQRVIWKDRLLRQFFVADRRCAVLLQPTLDVTPLISVPIGQYHWVMQALT
jgi:hypothetical protein